MLYSKVWAQLNTIQLHFQQFAYFLAYLPLLAKSPKYVAGARGVGRNIFYFPISLYLTKQTQKYLWHFLSFLALPTTKPCF